MTYATNSLITAADFNAMRNRLDTLVNAGSGDSGYGQSLSLPTVAVGDTIDNNEWQAMWDAYRLCHVHQTGTEPGEPTRTRFNPSAMVIAHATGSTGPGDLPGLITARETNRFTAAFITQTYFDDMGQRTTSWSDTISNTVRFTWGNADQARWFFNQGGNIHVALDHTDLSNPHDLSWRYAVLASETTGRNSVVMSSHHLLRTHFGGSTLSNGGYFTLGVGASIIGYSANSTGDYAANYHQITVFNGGSYVEFTATLEDNYTSTSETTPDIVNPGTIMHAAYQVPTTPGLTTYPPTVTNPKTF